MPAQLLGHGLHAVANAQHGDTQLKHRLGGAVCAFFVGTGMAARQHNAAQLPIAGKVAQPSIAHIARMDLAIHMGLTHPARDQLGDLRAEVEDQDFLVQHE